MSISQQSERMGDNKIGKCPFCSAESLVYFSSKDYNRRITAESFEYRRCSKCQLIFIDSIPDNPDTYYPDNYHELPKSTKELDSSSRDEKFKVDIVNRFAVGKRLLEIGASFGGFSYLAKKAGYEVNAVEMNPKCCKFLKEVIEINAIQSDDPVEALEHEKPYDVIALWHVIEHLPDAWSVLDMAYGKLKPGGIMIIASPNPDAFQFKILGRFWPHLDAPRHVTLIPMKLLIRKFESLGMKLELLTTKDGESDSLNSFGWKYCFIRISQRKPLNIIYRWIGNTLDCMFKPFDSIEGKGSAYTIVFRKPG